jgi:hypothetical protein
VGTRGRSADSNFASHRSSRTAQTIHEKLPILPGSRGFRRPRRTAVGRDRPTSKCAADRGAVTKKCVNGRLSNALSEFIHPSARIATLNDPQNPTITAQPRHCRQFSEHVTNR